MEGWRQYIASKANTFFIGAVAFLLATAAGLIFGAPFSLKEVFGLWVFSGVSLILCFDKPVYRSIFLLCFCAFFAFLRIHETTPRTSEHSHIGFYVNQKVAVTGVIKAEPDVRRDAVRYTVASQAVVSRGQTPVSGNVLLTLPLFPRYHYGDAIHFSCTLSWPKPRDGFQYDKYLERFDIYALCAYPESVMAYPAQTKHVFAYLLSFKERLAEQIVTIWPEPYAGFMAGLLYGYRGGLGSLDDSFRKTGLTHIVAVSGQNIMMVMSALLWVCFTVRLKRPYALTLALSGIVLFVFFTGASASVVRAGCMGVMMILAEFAGRGRSMRNVLVAVAALMVAVQPKMLLYDAGFALSFLATIGVIYTTPQVKQWFQWVPETLGLQEIICVSLAAIAWTLPLSVYQFGQMSFVAPIANIVVLPILPVILGAGVLATVIAAVLPPLGVFVGYVAYIGMRYAEGVVTLLARIPFVSVPVAVPLVFPVAAYTLLFVSVMGAYEKE